MEIYTTEEQQVESIKKWWKENGTSVIGGVVLGLGAVFGWKGWVAHQANVGEQASVLYEQLNSSLDLGAADLVTSQAEQLITEFGDTPYGWFAAMDQAKIAVDAGDTAAARGHLEWVLGRTDQSAIQQLVRLRLARIQLSEGDLDGATATLAGADAGSYAGEFAHLEGDIAVRRGDQTAARTAYEHALQNEVGNPTLVQMKLDDLAVSTGTEQAPAVEEKS